MRTSGITRCISEPSYPYPLMPVASSRKFLQVLGTMSSKREISMVPKSSVYSLYTLVTETIQESRWKYLVDHKRHQEGLERLVLQTVNIGISGYK